MKKKLLVTDLVHSVLLERFEAASFEVDYQPEITDAAVRKIIAEYSGLIINSKIRVDKEMLDTAVKLEFVGRLGSGMEIVDKNYAAEKKIAVYSSPEGNCNAVAEHALGMLLALYNNMCRANQQVRDFTWQREANRGFELAGKTIAVIGFGHTGSAFVRKLQGLNMNILVYDKYLPKGYINADFQQPNCYDATIKTTTIKTTTTTKTNYKTFAEESNYETIFEAADIVSLHLPLSNETRFFADDHFFAKFQKKITLINTSRGNVVDTQSLIKNLQSEKVFGACLDVFENEKPNTFSEREFEQYKKLYSFDNVILTPHIAGWTHESKRAMADVLCSKILNIK